MKNKIFFIVLALVLLGFISKSQEVNTFLGRWVNYTACDGTVADFSAGKLYEGDFTIPISVHNSINQTEINIAAYDLKAWNQVSFPKIEFHLYNGNPYPIIKNEFNFQIDVCDGSVNEIGMDRKDNPEFYGLNPNSSTRKFYAATIIYDLNCNEDTGEPGDLFKWYEGVVIYGADIIFNPYKTGVMSNGFHQDFTYGNAILLHELGHLLGLNHTDREEDIMYFEMGKGKPAIAKVWERFALKRLYEEKISPFEFDCRTADGLIDPNHGITPPPTANKSCLGFGNGMNLNGDVSVVGNTFPCLKGDLKLRANNSIYACENIINWWLPIDYYRYSELELAIKGWDKNGCNLRPLGNPSKPWKCYSVKYDIKLDEVTENKAVVENLFDATTRLQLDKNYKNSWLRMKDGVISNYAFGTLVYEITNINITNSYVNQFGKTLKSGKRYSVAASRNGGGEDIQFFRYFEDNLQINNEVIDELDVLAGNVVITNSSTVSNSFEDVIFSASNSIIANAGTIFNPGSVAQIKPGNCYGYYDPTSTVNFRKGQQTEKEEKINSQLILNSEVSQKTEKTKIINPIQEKAMVTLYPNPNNGTFTLSSNNGMIGEVQITSILGNVVYQQKLTTSQAQINLSNYGKGVYSVKINQKNQVFIKRVVVQ